MSSATPAQPLLTTWVVVGGAGAVGGLFVESLVAAGRSVSVVDTGPARPGARHLSGDITDIGPELAAELAAADAVVLAVPEPVALAAVKGVAAAMRPEALLVDTLSVKQPVVEAVRAQAPGREALALNPMFAPALGFEGRPVAAVVVQDGPRVREALALVTQWQGKVVEVDERDHDRLAAATQALTHAAVLSFGLALAELDVPIAELRAVAPPPHDTLLALLARIAGGTPEVYWDVQSANPQAPAARRELASAVRRIADLVEAGDEAGFEQLLGRLTGLLGPELDHYRASCAQIFAARS
ncbi:prephenate dehydrogenase/arogenate dehydrogenase family protein [Kitasatospora sp. NPDC002227]|uniref:prephenate dehydrogenase/arogenate dehydrogenase family protein n=1 Tax=Kitasatospora sp. NPDC002227 TaxID=3154773 RepID=UPI0033318109